MTVISKTCRKCTTEKSLDDFYTLKTSKDGKDSCCKECKKAMSRAWHAQNKDKAKVSRASYYRKNAKSFKKRASLWNRNNPERRKEIIRKYESQDRAIKRVRKATLARARRSKNLEESREYGRFAAAVRRDRKAQNGGIITKEWWKTLIDFFEVKLCFYCGKTHEKLVMDHFLPIISGGKTEVGNLIPCCNMCNAQKHSNSPKDWIIRNRGLGAYESAIKFLTISREAFVESMADRGIHVDGGMIYE